MKVRNFEETDDGKKVVEMKPLFGLTSKGKTKIWTITVIENDDKTAVIIQKYGEYGGKQQENINNIRKGKNLGACHETTPYQQALKEAISKYKKKIDQEGYSEDKDNLSTPRLPMLAKNHKDHKTKVEWPCFAQAKLDGIRVFAEKINKDTIKYTSRKGKPIETLSHITPTLLKIMLIDEVWDGEIYTPALSFQSICSAVKKQRDDSFKLELWIYDVANEKLDFKERYKRYYSAIKTKSYEDVSAPVKAVESILVHNEEELYNAHDEFVSQNFEGLICRSGSIGYQFKKRSDSLLKLKSFDDAEYKVVGGYEGSGSAEGHATLICVTDTGQEFGCTMRGSHEYRASLWKNLDKIVAAESYITVQFFGLTDAGLPRFPTGLGFRSGAINKNGIFEPDL